MPDEIINTQRDSAAREGVWRDYADYVADDVGGQQARNLATQMEVLEQGYGRDRDRPHEQRISRDEFGKIHEVNAEYLDTKLEEYLTKTLDTERQMQERKYGRGFLGRVRRYLNETTLGKSMKLAAKATVGGLCMAGIAGTGGLAAPLLFSLGTSTLVDTAAEAAQYFGFERSRIRQLRDTRVRRTQQVLRAMEVRNQIHRDRDEAAGMNHLININNNQSTLNVELNNILQYLDAEEQNIIGGERELARIRSIGGAVRGVLKLASSGAALHYGLTHGLSLGMQDFDKVNGPHEVLLKWSKGLMFSRNAAEQTAGLSALGEVGRVAPWSLLYAAGIGTAGALLANSGLSMAESIRQQQIEQNPKEAAIFSLRGRDRLGNAQNEISVSPPRQLRNQNATIDREGKIRETKAAMENVGEVWSWTRNNVAETIVIKGFSADGLRFAILDANGNEGSIMIYPANGVDEPYFNARRVAATREEYLSQRAGTEDAAVESARRARQVEKLSSGQVWRPANAVTLNRTDGTTANIGADQRIRIENVGEHSTTVRVNVVNADNSIDTANSGVYNAVDIINNFLPEAARTGEAQNARQVWDEAKGILRTATGEDIDKNQIWRIGTHWYVITAINSSNGMLMVHRGDVAAGARPSPQDVSNHIKNNYPEQLSFNDFLAEVNAGQGNIAYHGEYSKPPAQGGNSGNRPGGGRRSGGGT